MRRSAFFALACLLLAGSASAQAPDQTALASQFDGYVKPEEIGAWMKQMAAEPNHVSSPHDKINADFILAQFKAWGWDAHIETSKSSIPRR